MILEGKLPIEELKEIIQLEGFDNNEGIIAKSQIGLDASAINYNKAILKCREFYKTQDEFLLIVKSDPITFQTENPGKYSVIVNANDVTCLGGVPYGCVVTLLVPNKTRFTDILNIQKEIHHTCIGLEISILGGHTEITSAVNRSIISLSMYGFVPRSKLIFDDPQEGDLIALIGYIGNEGTAILTNELNSRSKNILYKKDTIKLFEENLYVGDIALELNKSMRLTRMHDPTEGGLLGAIYELIEGLKSKKGVIIYKKTLDKHIHDLTREISLALEINPLRLISSGTLLVIFTSDQLDKFHNLSKSFSVPVSIIGQITKDKVIFDDRTVIQSPKSDEIVKALTNIEINMKK